MLSTTMVGGWGRSLGDRDLNIGFILKPPETRLLTPFLD
ncbi:hypothetical protein Gotur_006911 [Gossypium turneri]